ncbi:MAG: site-specific integrase [Flavobacteriaceae bacterium]|nr:site-specific integrase [Flavobacteriaceae bacterium]
MRPNKKFGIHFWIKTSKKRIDGKVPIYARITLNGIRTDFSVKRMIYENEWCSRTGRAHPSAKISSTLNPYLDKVATEVRDCYEDFGRKKEYVTAHKIKERYLGGEQDSHTLTALINFHDQVELPKLAPGTAKNYSATENYLKKYLNASHKTEDIHLSQVDFAFILQFEEYLKNCKPLRACQPLGHNGAMKHMERFQKMMGLAHKFDWIPSNPFKRYQLKFREKEASFLEESELGTLEKFRPKNKRLALTLDMFLFSCYTGLSYIEVKQLRPQHIINGVDGEEWISVTRQKTRVPVKVPLLWKAKEILNVYLEDPRILSTGELLPIPTNQTVNRDIKILAKKAGIGKQLTFHSARHTFATTITLTNGVPIETVSKLLGHTKLSTTKRYARVIEQKISQDMANLRAKLDRSKKVAQNNAVPRTEPTKYPSLRIVK